MAVSSKIHIVDLFSGPGGLGEGFCAYTAEQHILKYHLGVSIEKDAAAHKTLRLRAFLRQFEKIPDVYYEFLAGNVEFPDWPALYPAEWNAAVEETWHAELGTPETAVALAAKIQTIKETSQRQTLLIGGPPCQAYSLVGRSRNLGVKDYTPSKDQRHFLYKEYCRVLSEFSPSVFVMENVKGMLSSSIEGAGIFDAVLNDLEMAGEGYQLFALSGKEPRFGRPDPRDFVLKSEEFGVPQARHRVIIVGIKRSISEKLPADVLPTIPKHASKSKVKDVLQCMPKLRSGLSRNDDRTSWFSALSEALTAVGEGTHEYAGANKGKFLKELNRVASANLKQNKSRKSTKHGKYPKSISEDLKSFLHDEAIIGLSCNETRGHMRSDLARYLYASCFTHAEKRSPKAKEFPASLAPNHANWESGKFSDRFRVQSWNSPGTTVTSHISKDGHYYIHPDASQCRSLTVREAARLQTFPDNYHFLGNRTEQFVQVGNAVPPYLAKQVAKAIWPVFEWIHRNE
ncbi:DNA (cytosine-5)-methyltransferase 1 [Pacificibacter maritimus]|uniref:DNA (cytosine-5-)-methyltransferase n=1 Tax=Pacificibacter maritimus TaxID=762213 RepID=A0A3N4UY08_9RHOB|nr:DNA cytosine methyltransferase [Pacificibacter maritimus]RPE66460.1 DNA (cytosine-5)-methyltransferase 1 [Pacificibacter maritimus]